MFREYYQTILTAIQTSVCDVADKCYTRGIIAESVYRSVVHGVKTPGEKTRELLTAVGDQIRNDEQIGQTADDSRFEKFVGILEEDAVHKDLVRSLRDACLRNGKEPQEIEAKTDGRLANEVSGGQEHSSRPKPDSGIVLELSSTDIESTTEVSSLSGLAETAPLEYSTLFKQPRENTDAVVPELEDDVVSSGDESEDKNSKPVEETQQGASNVDALVVEKETSIRPYPLEKKLLDAASEVREVCTEKDKLMHERDDIREQLLRKEQQLKQMELELERTEQKRDSEARRYEKKNSELCTMISAREKEIETLRRDLEVQQTLQEENKQLSEGIAELQQRLSQEESQKEEAERELAATQEEHDKNEALYISMEQQLKEKISKVGKEKNQLEDYVTKLESWVIGIKQERDRFRRKSMQQKHVIEKLSSDKRGTWIWCTTIVILLVLFCILMVVVVIARFLDPPDHCEL